MAPEASAATIRAGAVAARKRKVGSGAEVPAAKAVAWLGALSTSPSARPLRPRPLRPRRLAAAANTPTPSARALTLANPAPYQVEVPSPETPKRASAAAELPQTEVRTKRTCAGRKAAAK